MAWPTQSSRSDEVEKYAKIAQKYKNIIHWVVHEFSVHPIHGKTDTLTYVSSNKEKVKNKVKAWKNEGRSIVVVEIDPQKQSARWIYTCGSLPPQF